jgi:cell division topological specificity factor
MSIFKFLRRGGSAPVARERLQILLAHERSAHERNARGQPDLIAILHGEILAVVGKHVQLDPDKVQINIERGTDVSMLEIDIELPSKLGLVTSSAA